MTSVNREKNSLLTEVTEQLRKILGVFLLNKGPKSVIFWANLVEFWVHKGLFLFEVQTGNSPKSHKNYEFSSKFTLGHKLIDMESYKFDIIWSVSYSTYGVIRSTSGGASFPELMGLNWSAIIFGGAELLFKIIGAKYIN